MKKAIIAIFFILSIIILVKIRYYPTRESLTVNFNENERAFKDAVFFFNNNIRINNGVVFGLSGSNKVSLLIYPLVISPTNRIVGGRNIQIGSNELDSALRMLGWSLETLELMKVKLRKTGCDYIQTTEIDKFPIVMYPEQFGLGKYSYSIYLNIVNYDKDSSNHRGKPISNSQFDLKVYLDYRSPL